MAGTICLFCMALPAMRRAHAGKPPGFGGKAMTQDRNA